MFLILLLEYNCTYKANTSRHIEHFENITKVDTIQIAQPIRLFLTENNKTTIFFLSLKTFNQLTNFKRNQLINHPKVYLTTRFMFSFLDPKAFLHYPNADNNSADEERVIINKNLEYVPIKSEMFIFFTVNVDVFNKKERSLDFKKINAGNLKSRNLQLAYELTVNN